ncbi:MAG: hypothetical protein ABIJ56_14995 [Pseudomonadota bacterium]
MDKLIIKISLPFALMLSVFLFYSPALFAQDELVEEKSATDRKKAQGDQPDPPVKEETADKAGAREDAKDGGEVKKEKKKWWQLKTQWPPDSCAGHWFFQIGIGTGTGYVTGKVYEDNPKTPDVDDDGPEISDNSAETGLIARWSLGYILKRGLGLAVFARYQLSNGGTPGYDSDFDAWLIGVRVLRLFYVNGRLNILPYLHFGYGMMRHIIKNTILPKGESGDFYRASGNFDAGLGVQFVYRFTPVFNIFIDLVGDVMFPTIAINLDVIIGLGLSY